MSHDFAKSRSRFASELHKKYLSRKEKFDRNSREYRTKIIRMGFIRPAVFLAGVFLTAYLSDIDWRLGLIVFLTFAAVFGYLVKQHQRLKRQRLFFKTLSEINDAETEALSGRFPFDNNGREYLSPEHDFAGDLDLFGPSSFFQYLNRSFSHGGSALLAEWLKSGKPDADRIRARQQAVAELAEKEDFRQFFMAENKLRNEEADDESRLLSWASAPEKINFGVMGDALKIVLPVITISLFAISFIYPLWTYFGLSVLLQLFVNGFTLKEVNAYHAEVSHTHLLVRKLAGLLRLSEEEEFESRYLQELKEGIGKGDEKASKILDRFGGLLDAFDVRLNMIGGILANGTLMWDRHCVSRLEALRLSHGKRIGAWVPLLHEFDALLSLGTYASNHPEFVMPELRQEGFRISAEGLGHPMIPAAERVSNSFTLEHEHEFMLITGANMAGKSTFLRTVGLAWVKASTGLPVCAEKLEISPLTLYTGMRAIDSLSENTSSFYAELKRLQGMIERLEQGEKLFVLLDEILKGTNSKDRHDGSVGLIRKLIRLKANGMITTHDLALGNLEDEYPENVHNYAFEVQTVGDRLEFDYTLKRGVCGTMNAIHLMKKMGITD